MKTPRLTLPLLSVGQAQKEITHNEALILIDSLILATCRGGPRTDVPVGPNIGDLFVVGDQATAAWAGHSGDVAVWTEGGWRFVAPKDGFRLIDGIDGCEWCFRDGEWQKGIIVAKEVMIEGRKVLGRQGLPIADATGGAVIDLEARLGLSRVLDALRGHGLIEMS